MSDIENRTQPSGVAYRTPGEAGHNGPADASAVAVVIVETDRFTRPGNFERWVALIETKGQDLANRTGAPVYIRYYNQSRGKGENGHVVFTPD